MGANTANALPTGDGVPDTGLDRAAAADLARASLEIARRFAAGGTLWCLAPTWPEHGRHVAVEFVHPVIMGKRALPALSVPGADPVAALRTSSRPGDALLVIAPGDSSTAADAVGRTPAWGLGSVWIGSGARPPAGLADHVIWVDGDDVGAAQWDGSLVLRYHLLWELTHVCLEHPGLLAPERDATGPLAAWCSETSCITCVDEGRAAEVAAVLGDGLVSVRTARGLETVDASLVGEVGPGDLLLVHAGTAIERWTVHDG